MDAQFAGNGQDAKVEELNNKVKILEEEIIALKETLSQVIENGAKSSKNNNSDVSPNKDNEFLLELKIQNLIDRIIRHFVLEYFKSEYNSTMYKYKVVKAYALFEPEGGFGPKNIWSEANLAKFGPFTWEQFQNLAKFIKPGYLSDINPTKADFNLIITYLSSKKDTESIQLLEIMTIIARRLLPKS